MTFITELGQQGFLQLALLAGAMGSVSAGVVGTYVVARRIAYLAGSISHFVLAGMGAARYLQVVHGVTWLSPTLGALFAALLAALIISFIRQHSKQREDTVIGALWAVGMAVGILFIAQTPGYNEDLTSYLFGNILMVNQDHVTILAILDVVTLAFGVWFYRTFLAISFDEEFTKVRGINSNFYYTLLLVLTSITVVVLTTVVGLILVIAFLTLPAASAAPFVKRLWQMMLLASLLNFIYVFIGLWISFELDWPSGATIIVVSAASYLMLLLIGSAVNRVSARG